MFIYCSHALQTVFRGYLSAGIRLVYGAPQRLPLSLHINGGREFGGDVFGPWGNRLTGWDLSFPIWQKEFYSVLNQNYSPDDVYRCPPDITYWLIRLPQLYSKVILMTLSGLFRSLARKQIGPINSIELFLQVQNPVCISRLVFYAKVDFCLSISPCCRMALWWKREENCLWCIDDMQDWLPDVFICNHQRWLSSCRSISGPNNAKWSSSE